MSTELTRARSSGAVLAHALGKVDKGLGLVLGRVLLCIGAQDGPFGSPGAGKRHPVDGVGPVQEPGNDPVFALRR